MILRLVLLLAFAAVLVAVAVFDAAAPTSCRDADSQLAKGLIGQASTGYKAILTDEPQSRCATRGLLRAARRRCTSANRVLATVPGDEARKALAAMLAEEPPEPAVTCAVAGLARLSRQAARAGKGER